MRVYYDRRKLDCFDIINIIKDFIENEMSVRQISIKYGVSRLTITNILLRKNYKDCFNEDDYPMYFDRVVELLNRHSKRKRRKRRKSAFRK